MINITEKQNCCGCHACYNICPLKCIHMQSDEEGFWYPAVNTEECTNCGLCEKACPILSENAVDNYPTAYACINKDDDIRLQSSSGGIFTPIAEKVIDNNGVVFGAGFDGDFNVVHSWVDSLDGLSGLRGSKYVQSCIGDTYNHARYFLKQGRQVLFSGTPCQIAGLRSFLGEDYENVENLVCLDIICHGVPSPRVWRRYKLQLEQIFQAKARRIAFRRKNCGWKLYSVSLSFDNDTEYSHAFTKDLYTQGFLRNVYLRPSCYECSFKTLNRQSDLTLADFWGIGKVLPSFDDDKGTSLVLVNSAKGKAVFSSVVEKIDFEKVDINQAVLYNPSTIKAVNYNPKRDLFFQELAHTADINQLIAKYTKVSFFRKIYVGMIKLLSRVKRKITG